MKKNTKSKKVERHTDSNKKLVRNIEIIFILTMLSIFSIKVTNYLHWQILSPKNISNNIRTSYDGTYEYATQLKYFRKCPNNMIKIEIGSSYLCRSETKPSVYQKIFDTHPRNSQGRNKVYPYSDELNIKTANDLIDNKIDIPRYNPYQVTQSIKWNEDPYNDRYWRFNYYSLRPLESLLIAWQETGDAKYKTKLEELTNSFINNGTDQKYSWDDNHAVAFRTMILIDIWTGLREKNSLPIETSNNILRALEKHGSFLNDRNHYEPQHNHGTNESAALFLLSYNFPELQDSLKWQETSKLRLTSGLIDLVDEDGSLIENSPYYHFYTLQKYWDIYKYSEKYNIPLGDNFKNKLEKMINYGTYILQPNSRPPLIGSSLSTTIHMKKEFIEIANKYPEFKYVLTQGKSGKKPKNNSIYFASSGQAIMRSGWDAKNYTQQTQTIFDVGPYRTKHSHLDALSVNIYGGGISLLPDAGLYSYDSNKLHDYFHGSSAHNTVTVDGKDQSEGTAVAGKYTDNKDYTSMSGEESLNSGVIHKRSVTQIGQEVVVVIDKLKSDQFHDYSQQFHLFPGANIEKNNLNVIGTGEKPQQRISIDQLITQDITQTDEYNNTSKPAGLCSIEYAKTIPCHQIAYNKHAKNAEFVTVIEIGKKHSDLKYSLSNDNSVISLQRDGKSFELKIDEQASVKSVAKLDNIERPKIQESNIDMLNNVNGFVTENGVLSQISDSSRKSGNGIKIETKNKDAANIQKIVNLDLSKNNLLFYLKVNKIKKVSHIELSLSNNNGNSYMTTRLGNSYRNTYDGQWVGISLGKSLERDRGGEWTKYGNSFDWSNIDKVKFLIQTDGDEPVSMELSDMSLLKPQDKGKVIPVFDDGYDSVLNAVPIMNKYHIKGNVGVISRYPERHQKGYLTLEEIKRLQNTYGWNIINHSNLHKPAVETYYDNSDLAGFEEDILHGAKYLESNNINSDPNWYIYPHGSNNETIKNIVGKYYKYARSTQTGPEVFPFGDPLAVKTFAVQNDTPPEAIEKAIDDAKNYNTTLFLTFHRIQNKPSDREGYKAQDFERVMKKLSETDIQKLTFKEYDESNGVQIGKFTFKDGSPEQIQLNVKVKKNKIWGNILSNIRSVHIENSKRRVQSFLLSR